MPQEIEIRIHIPDDLGLTPQQIAELKQRVRIEIVASTLPAHGFTMHAPLQCVIHPVNGNLGT
jgi:hypothetical protein